MELTREELRQIIQEELELVLEAKRYHWNEPDWHYDGGYGDPESPHARWYLKKEEFSKKERAKRRKKCDNPKGFTMKQFCKNQKTRSKKGERKNEEIEEVYSDKQRRFMCAVSKQGADRPKGLSKAEAEEMCKGPMKEADPKKGTGKKPKGSSDRDWETQHT